MIFHVDTKTQHTNRYEDTLPLADLFNKIDTHFQARLKLEEMKDSLDRRAKQFRVVQKRLLVRYKDRNSAPLNGLDVLMRGTYEQIVQETEQVEVAQKHLRVAARRLRVTLRLLLFLMKLKFQLDNESYDVLVSSFCVNHLCEYETEEQGWEEVVDASLVHLLRTTLSSSSSSSSLSVAETRLKMPSNTNRLKKHIAVVADRLSKGCSLKSKKSESTKKKVLSKSASVAIAPTKTSEESRKMRKKKVRMSMIVEKKSDVKAGQKLRIKLKRKKKNSSNDDGNSGGSSKIVEE